MIKICGIYKISSPSGKIYIGQSRNINRRIQKYKYAECNEQPKIYHSIVKYGWEAHRFELICECEVDKLNVLEKHYIKQYDTFNTEYGLNLTDGGEGADVTDETREKIRRSKLGVKRSNATKLKLSEGKRGIPPHINCRNKSGSYEIYNENNELIHKFEKNIKIELKRLNLPSHSFCRTYRNNSKINKGTHKGWYIVKLKTQENEHPKVQ